MGDDKTQVDVLTLEDFRATLNARLIEAQSILDTLTNKLAHGPSLGTFMDATGTRTWYNNAYQQHVQRATRLVDAIKAAQRATDGIIKDYTTTEARNAANQADIAKALGNVQTTLDGEATSA
jgi:ABC-type transporter Mla subunit MlaD